MQPILKHILGQSPLGFHRMAYAEWGEATARPPVICVHGLTRNGRDFDWLAEALQTTTRVFCPDIAGRGASDWLGDPSLYGYPQYVADMVAMIARTGAEQVDWVGTSMGGIIGMLIAAQPNSPIRRLVINDVGAFLPLAALKRIGGYVGQDPAFADLAALEAYLRKVTMASFGITRAEDFRHLAHNSFRTRPDGALALAYDPKIADAFRALDKDVDLWPVYDRIRCPTLLLHGALSDILPSAVAEDMTRRGPRASCVTIENVGHAPALIDPAQIRVIQDFLGI